MKKLHILSAITVFIFIVVITSCKKSSSPQLSNWTCHCSMQNGSGTYTNDYAEQNMTQGDATTACANWQVKNSSATTTAVCQIQQ